MRLVVETGGVRARMEGLPPLLAPCSVRGSAVEVDDKLPERAWNADCWEETSNRRVESSGGAIRWVLPAGDVACDKKALVSICEVVDASENLVGLPVSASALPPTFNNSLVVSKDPEVLAWLTGGAESASKKLEANGFSPSDVSALCLPSWEEAPHPPPVANNNADAKT